MAARIRAWRWFFPAVTVHAALVLPLSLQAMLSAEPGLPGLARHGGELLSGFGFGTVAGYLLGSLPAPLLSLLFLLWLGARLASLLLPAGLLPFLLQGLFAGAVALVVVPRFLGRGRKLRNLSLAPLLALLALGSVLTLLPAAPGRERLLLAEVLLFAWLMAFMGGRLLAPAAAGALQRQGERPRARVQPRLEGMVILLLGLAVAGSLLPVSRIGGVAALLAGLLLAIRLLRWRLWRCRGRWDLWCLGLGYGWLAAGLVLLGAAMAGAGSPWTSLHGITVGAMGTLTFNIMLRTAMQRGAAVPGRYWLIPAGTLLLGLAALARLLAPLLEEDTVPTLILAAVAWSVAFLLLSWRLLTLPPRPVQESRVIPSANRVSPSPPMSRPSSRNSRR